jgi:hypothetical protein
MKIILGLLGIIFGGSILYHQIHSFHVFTFFIGCLFFWLGLQILKGKITL